MNKKPNILLLFSDQHQAACMGSENHPDVQTPNLDTLANEGVRFTRAYCQDAICVPSRVSMMTGIHPKTLDLFDNSGTSDVLTKIVPMSEYFSKQGYTTAAFGKRHLITEKFNADKPQKIEFGWDIKKNHLTTEGDEDHYGKWIEQEGYLEEFTRDWATEFGHGPQNSPTHSSKIPVSDFSFQVSQLPEDKTMEAYTALESIEFIKSRKNSEKPFFLWSSFYRPHQPYTPLGKYYELYKSNSWGDGLKTALESGTEFNGIKKPDSFPENFQIEKEKLPPLFQEQYEGGNRVWRIDRAMKNEQIYRNYIAAYYALVTEIDSWIGKIVNCLKEQGLYDNTIIIYTSDHGDFVGRHGMVEKCAPGHNIFEETLRVPLIIHYPEALNQGEVNEALVELTDIYPTLIDLTGENIPEFEFPLKGKSLAPLCRSKNADTVTFREFSISMNRSQATIITKRYKLGIWIDPGESHRDVDYRSFGHMLFDRKTDPLELNNLYGQEQYAEITHKLTAELESFLGYSI